MSKLESGSSTITRKGPKRALRVSRVIIIKSIPEIDRHVSKHANQKQKGKRK